MRKILLLAMLLSLTLGATAQEPFTPARSTTNDFRGRVEGAFEWEVVDDLTLEAGVQLRLNNDLATVDRIQTSVGANYEVNKYFDFGADYVLINGYEADVKAWDKPRHRVNVNVRGKVKVGRVVLSLRERLQTTFRTDSVNRYEKMNPELMLRSRLMAEYSIRHSRWSPYAMFELNNTLNAPKVVDNYKKAALRTDNYIARYRLGVGAKFRISRYHRLDFYYYFDYDRGYDIDYKGNKGTLKGYVQENEFRHTFGISYKFKL
ncbi:MAG: DUF2490 domain-containing protein [Alistipes sp.]|nr:DUF2490 domain-containing protein [Alistipes sp.]